MRSTTQNNQRNRYTKETEQKKYCSVCHKAGKTEKEYTSHFTKSVPGDKGIVVCPTILRNLCNKCNKYGHFADYCKESRDYCKGKPYVERHVSATATVKPEVPTYEEVFPAIGEEPTCGKKRVREVSKNMGGYNILGDDNDDTSVRRTTKVAPRTTLNFKKAIETEPPKPKEEEPTFGGVMTILSNSRPMKHIQFDEEKPLHLHEAKYEEEDDYYEEEYYEEEFDMEEIDRRISERDARVYNYDEEEW